MRTILFNVILLALQYFIYFQFVRFLKTTKSYKPSYRLWAAIPFLLFDLPFTFVSIVWANHFEPPEWFRTIFMNPFYVWIGATFFIFQWLLIGKLIKLPFKIPIWIMKIFKPLRERIKRFKEKETVRKVDYSRRQFVRYSTLAVSAYAFGAASYGIIKNNDYKITYRDIKIENLPQELKGTTITLLSDIHAGQYMTEKDMTEYAEIMNNLGSDIICIPGDFVNFNSEDSHYVAKAFRDLKAKHGIYGTLGNHDFFQNPDYVADVMNNESPVKILRDSHNKITINGKDLFMLGVDDNISSGNQMNGATVIHIDEMNKYLVEKEPGYNNAPKILMCHKPYAFDEIAKRDFDLILSGHTHGGQVVPFKYGDINISFAALVSKYIEGLYKIGKCSMYVSRGIGSVGLPIRLNCPPEITKITLV